MSQQDEKSDQVEALLATPDLADALESEHFRHFLDQIPIAIVIAEIKDGERIVYANPEFEKLSGQAAAEIVDQPWTALKGDEDGGRTLGDAVVAKADYVGTFKMPRADDVAVIDAYSNIIEDDDGTPCYRLAALVDSGPRGDVEREELEQRLRDKDTQLQEIQHRVKNNLQMITALIRIEARNARGRVDSEPFDRLAGRIESIQTIYRLLSDLGENDLIDLGIYLSEIASSVMRSHAVEGIRLDLKVDTYPVSVNVAMPTGLVVNELLTNALKHAFVGRDGGTITLHSLSEGDGCRIIVADDGAGLPDGVEWPRRGKLSALIVQSLRENARAQMEIESKPDQGMRVTIAFKRANAGSASAA
jgi:PAS domain S-box-containing protein